jgi:c-di-GMP-specific phosphodiesterase
MAAGERLVWDATTVLEALGAADAALWVWEPDRDRVRLSGASRALGLGPLAPEAPSAALRALVLPQDRAAAEEMLKVREPGTEISARLRMRGAEPCLWRGVWLEEGLRAAGVVAKELRFSASERDSLTGLLDRRSFVVRAREKLTQAGSFELVVADLNRLRRLNEALGHERADLVLAALGSRLAAAFSDAALMARIGEDEFAVLAPKGGCADTLRAALE